MSCPVRAVLLVALLLLAGATVHAEWNVASSPNFTYCLSAVTCSGYPVCADSELVIEGSCERECFRDYPGTCLAWCGAAADPGWSVKGEGFGFLGGGFAEQPPILQAMLLASGNRLSDELFEVDLSYYKYQEGTVRAELALIRYAGDPVAFEDLRVKRVSELVDSELIQESDILFLEQYGEQDVEQLYEVDVAGIPDDHLILFTVGVGESVPIPATGTAGAVALGGILLACGTCLLILRRRGAASG